MLRGALEEVEGILSRVEPITSKPLEPCKPVREPQPPTNNKKNVVAPRTPKPTNGGSIGAQCIKGVGTVFPSQDVRIKQVLKLGISLGFDKKYFARKSLSFRNIFAILIRLNQKCLKF